MYVTVSLPWFSCLQDTASILSTATAEEEEDEPAEVSPIDDQQRGADVVEDEDSDGETKGRSERRL